MHDVAYARDKTCSRCKTEKPLDDFHRDATHGDDRATRCKACVNASKRKPDGQKRACKRCIYCKAATAAPNSSLCSNLCKEQYAWEKRPAPLMIRECQNQECQGLFVVLRPSLRPSEERQFRNYCSEACRLARLSAQARDRYDPAKERAKRDKRMRAINLKHTDITAAHIAKLYRQTKACPLCDVRLTATPTQPNSREVDHIIPINVGGTHTIGNVRVICRACNLARPKDGSDIDAHQPTLWAADTTAAAVVADMHSTRQRARAEKDAARSVRKRAREALADQNRLSRSEAVKRRASAMLERSRNGVTLDEIAEEFGYKSGTSAYATMWRHFPVETVEASKLSASKRSTQPSRVDRAIALRQAGMTWNAIAADLGYANGKNVANTIKRGRGIDLSTLRQEAA